MLELLQWKPELSMGSTYTTHSKGYPGCACLRPQRDLDQEPISQSYSQSCICSSCILQLQLCMNSMGAGIQSVRFIEAIVSKHTPRRTSFPIQTITVQFVERACCCETHRTSGTKLHTTGRPSTSRSSGLSKATVVGYSNPFVHKDSLYSYRGIICDHLQPWPG